MQGKAAGAGRKRTNGVKTVKMAIVQNDEKENGEGRRDFSKKKGRKRPKTP